MIVPRFVTQHTAPAVLGFKNARSFLEWLATSGCPVITRGKDRFVRLEHVEEALTRGAESMATESPAVAARARELETVDEVLGALRRRRAVSR